MKLFYILSLVMMVLLSCCKDDPLFTNINPSFSGISFANIVTEYDSFNILNTEFIYNGAGVAIGDLNGDGLEDLYFTGNQVENKCYLNLGGLKFKDITAESGTQKYPGQWSSGVNIIDLNGDGKKDIYVCNTLIKNASLRRNLLFINQGNENGIPKFLESAEAYGVDDTSHSSHAQFFDFDRDGDLDLFIGTNFIDRKVPGVFVKDLNDDCDMNCDKLYRNDWDSIHQHPYFVDISSAAGMSFHGYSHSTLINDFNEDGWQDIYVANDYLSDDLIYINNQDGTFTNKVGNIFRHQSSSAMGSDLGDINNDGQMELMTVEMLPFTNLRKKTLIGPGNYASYLYIKEYGYQYQYTRNTLQLNEGLNATNHLPVYDEISFLSGVHETEWSWAPLFADFDLDGYEDLYVTNGFPKDVTDHDFGEYRAMADNLLSDMDLQAVIPQVKVSNFLFHNNRDLTFSDVSEPTGVHIKSFSNGAAYGDLDNDGDLDLVVQNIDDVPFLFKNNTKEHTSKKDSLHFVTIQLKGGPFNSDAFGAKVQVFEGPSIQTRYILSGRGYLSQSSNRLQFGLKDGRIIDSVKVYWPEGTINVYRTPSLSTPIILSPLSRQQEIQNAAQDYNGKVFQSISPSSIGLNYVHQEKDFIDFNIQKTLPHKMSQQGVPMCTGDLNGDGLEDIIIGGSAHHQASMYFQNKQGIFDSQYFDLKSPDELQIEDAAMATFDADGDGDLDLMIAGGSYENLTAGKSAYVVRFYKNDGHGHFERDTSAIPASANTCASTLRVADIDLDGDLDIFIGGYVLPGTYPKADKSFILLNESTKGHIKFKNATGEWKLPEPGMICDGLFSDFDNDGLPDLILAVEWGPITVLKNTGTEFQKVMDPVLDSNPGWWTSLTSGDIDNDGDIDYIVGNYGQNTYFKCNSKEPITIYAKDFDQNGSLDPFISCYWRDTNGIKREYFYHGRDEMIKQLLTIRRKFQTYTSYGLATVDQVFSKKELEGALILKANNFNSVLARNDGKGHFLIENLPREAQMAPLYGMQALDLNDDEYLDLVISGNDYGIELIQGRADAMQGLVLLNDKHGDFIPVSFQLSGYFISGDAKSLVSIHNPSGENIFLQMINLDSLAVHKTTHKTTLFYPNDNEYSGIMTFQHGLSRKIEFYSGTSYKSQSRAGISLSARSTQLQVRNAISKSVRTIN